MMEAIRSVRPAGQRLKLLLLLSAALLLPAAGCGSDICEDGYNRRKECLQGLDCSRMDPSMQAACQQEKSIYTISYAYYKAACQKSSGTDCACEGDERARWEKYTACTIEPEALCECR